MDLTVVQGHPTYTFSDYAGSMRAANPPPPGASWQMPGFFGVGVTVTVLLTIMRANFFWWPLHPQGYALSGSWSTIEFWFPCLLAWGCKSLVLRYGGMRVYGRARPLFLGMVLGAFGMALLFVLLDAVSPEDKIPVPPFPWG